MSTFNFKGTISHGTMLMEDLIPDFLSALDAIREDQSFAVDSHTPEAIAQYAHEDDALGAIERNMREPGYYDSESAYWDLESLFEMLDNRAPTGYYFGAHEGDGSDYGYWPIIQD